MPWANVAERGRGQAGRFGRGDAPGESGPQGPPATTHTGATLYATATTTMPSILSRPRKKSKNNEEVVERSETIR